MSRGLSPATREAATRVSSACAELADPGWPVVADPEVVEQRCRDWLGLGLPPEAVVALAHTPLPSAWFAACGAAATAQAAPTGDGWVLRWRSVVWVALGELSRAGRLPAPERAAADAVSQRPWSVSLRASPEGRATMLLALLGDDHELADWLPLVVGRSRLAGTAADAAFYSRLGLRDVARAAAVGRSWGAQLAVLGLDAPHPVPEAPAHLLRTRVLPVAAVTGGRVEDVLAGMTHRALAPGQWWVVPLPPWRRLQLAAAGIGPEEAESPSWLTASDDDLDVLAALRA